MDLISSAHFLQFSSIHHVLHLDLVSWKRAFKNPFCYQCTAHQAPETNKTPVLQLVWIFFRLCTEIRFGAFFYVTFSFLAFCEIIACTWRTFIFFICTTCNDALHSTYLFEGSYWKRCAFPHSFRKSYKIIKELGTNLLT